MKWLRVASKTNPITDGTAVNPAAPLTVEAKGERAKIRELRQRLEKENDPSDIKALSDAIDALESRMEKDITRREQRKKDKAEKAKAKEAESAATPAPVVEVEAARPHLESEDEANPELGMDHDDEEMSHHHLPEHHNLTMTEDEEPGNPMQVLPGDIVDIDLPSQDGTFHVEVDMTAGTPQILSIKLDGLDVDGPALEHLLSSEEFMSDVEHAAIAKASPAAEDLEAVPASLDGAARTAAEDGEEKDDDDKETDMPKDEKDDKPKKEEKPKSDSPAPKKKDSPAAAAPKKAPAAPAKPHDEAGDEKEASEAIELLRDLIKKEHGEGEGGAHVAELEKALALLEKFLGEEEGEAGDAMFKAPMPGAPGPKGPAAPAPGAKPGPGMKPMTMEILPPPAKSPAGLPPMKGPAAMPAASAKGNPWVLDSTSGIGIGRRVWRKAMTGSIEYVGDESGRVIAEAGDGKVVVDWGDEVPTENLVAELSVVETTDGEADIFVPTPDIIAADDSEGELEARTAEEEAAAILSGLSLKDMLASAAEQAAANEQDAIVHLASGKVGKFIAEATDGRVIINVGGREMMVYAYEITSANTTGEGLF